MLSLNLFAADLTLYTDVYVDDDDIVTPFAVQDNGEDGASDSDAIEVYIPFKSGTGAAGTNSDAELNASYYSELPYVDSLDLFYDDDGAGTQDGTRPCLIFTVTSKQTSTSYTKLHFMVNNGSGTYKRVNISTTSCLDAYSTTSKTAEISNGANKTFYVSWKSISDVNTADEDDWNDDDSVVTIDSYIFIYNSETDSVAEDDLDEAAYDNGLYFELNFSADESETPATLSGLAKGDTQLTLTYDATDSSEGDLDQLVFISAYGPVTANSSWQSYKTSPGGDELPNTSDADDSGEFKLTGLTNERLYYITLSARDVFYFMSPLPATLENTPQPLKAFIQEKSCYLLSAGFQTDHPVLEYFRQWRDHTLARFSFGKKFIRWYYATAPHYTQVIIDHPALAAIVRAGGYLAYGLVRFFWWWVGLLSVSIVIFSLAFFGKRLNIRPKKS